MAGMIGFLVYRLWRGGPYIHDYYLPLSLEVLICWQSRRRNYQFDHNARRSHHLLRQKSLSIASNDLLVVPISSAARNFNGDCNNIPSPMLTTEKMTTERALLSSPDIFRHHRRHSSIQSNLRSGAVDLEYGPMMYSSTPAVNNEMQSSFKVMNMGCHNGEY